MDFCKYIQLKILKFFYKKIYAENIIYLILQCFIHIVLKKMELKETEWVCKHINFLYNDGEYDIFDEAIFLNIKTQEKFVVRCQHICAYVYIFYYKLSENFLQEDALEILFKKKIAEYITKKNLKNKNKEELKKDSIYELKIARDKLEILLLQKEILEKL